MQIDINEFAAAKAIFFLNPDADDLSADVRMEIAETRAKVTNALYRYLGRRLFKNTYFQQKNPAG